MSGCDSSGGADVSHEGSGIFPPARLRNASEIDFSNVIGIANVNGQTFEMMRVGERYQVEIPGVIVNSDLSISIEYRELMSEGRELLLAQSSVENFRAQSTDLLIEFTDDQYNFDFDLDSDGVTNIQEREDGTDPFSAEPVLFRQLTVQFNIPAVIENPRVIRIVAVVANETRTPVNVGGSFFQVVDQIPGNIEVTADIRLSQLVNTDNSDVGIEVDIARAVSRAPAGIEDLEVTITDQDFDFGIDSDRDGVNNYDEILRGTNPFVDE